MNRWEGKIAVVTGPTLGIGLAITTELVKHGLIVAGLARTQSDLSELEKKLSKEKGNFVGFQCDITNENFIKTTFKKIEEKLGPISILVNSAGYAANSTLINGEVSIWKKVFDTNVLSLCMTTKTAIQSMKINNINGHIIHINSIKCAQIPNMNAYPASKNAVSALCETLRHEINREKLKIKITSVSPGVVKTKSIKEYKQQYGDSFEFDVSLEPKDIADAVVYAISTPEHVNVTELTVQPVGEEF